MNAERRTKYSGHGSTIVKSNKLLSINLDNRTLEIMCKCIVTNSQTFRRGQLINLRNLIFLLNPDTYENDSKKSSMISFIKKGLEARLSYNLSDPYMIMSHIYGGILDDAIINLDEFNGLSGAEMAWLNSMISEALKYSHMYSNVDMLMDICMKIKSAEFGSKSDLIKEFEGAIVKIQNAFRRCRNEDQTEAIFSLRDEYFTNVVYDTHKTLSSPRRKLNTGMQGMNELLGGGFENGRCYVYFGLPGEGKSTIILNMAYQLKKYNKDYITKDPTKRPCIVLLTMENTVVESVERLFGIATNKSSMTDFSPESVVNMLREDGELFLTDNDPIDIIIKFKPSNSVDTSYLYTLVEDLEDEGMEAIAVFQDYIGRIRSTERLQDTRLEYGAIVDEFKTFAEIKDVPVITVAQLNRDASKHIDEGRKASKADLVRLIGRSNISESMLILNNIDAGFLIAPEVTQKNEKFLGVQRIKIRYKAGNREYVYLPFMRDSLKLLEDFGRIPAFKTSLRGDSDIEEGLPISQYQTNRIMDMGQIMKVTSNENNIFSTTVMGSLEAPKACSRPLITPFI